MFSSLINRTALKGRSSVSTTLILTGALLVALLATGCGGDKAENDFSEYEDNSKVLAKVGDGVITSNYYENRLSKMLITELPTEDGVVLDTAKDVGKIAFLEALVNKEIMNQKAILLGYNLDTQVVSARMSMIEYESSVAMWKDIALDDAATISEEEMQEFYANMGTEYICHYIICDLESDALEARKYALTGADWDDVAAKYHDGTRSTTQAYDLSIPYGQYSRAFEDKVYETELGGVTQPILSSYGYWVIRVVEIKHNKKPALEQAKARILDVTRNRKIGARRDEFKMEMRAKYNFKVNQDALWAVFKGMPENGIMDPATNEPFKKDQLRDLEVSTESLGLVFYSYTGRDGESVESTVADYKAHFDKMSVFQRPKKDEMLGGLRGKIESEIERGIMNIEAEKRGYFERPDIVALVDKKIEEIMVTRLYSEAVVYDDKITADQMDEFWAEHRSEYFSREARSGHVVFCLNRQKADEAFKAGMAGTKWKKILLDFGSDQENKKRNGKVEFITEDSPTIFAKKFFEMNKGEISQPFAIENGRYAVVQLDSIKEAKEFELHEVSEAVGGRMNSIRQEKAFVKVLDVWSEEVGVELFNENLAGLKSWEELTEVVVPENLVLRK